jgi:hypothetical protein
MAKMTSMWVHAQNAAPEWRPREFTNWGWGAHFKLDPGADLWVHLPIPTPVLLLDRRASLHAVHYMFATSGRDFVLANIHIRDGLTLISQQDLPLSDYRYGKHDDVLDAQNGTQVDRNGFQWGLGLSLHFLNTITPPQPPGQGIGEFWFSGAGADFYHDL